MGDHPLFIQDISNAKYFIDKKYNYTIEDLKFSGNITWEKVGEKTLNFGPEDFSLWIQFQIQNPLNQDQIYFLKYDFPSIDNLDIYELNSSNEIINQIKSGDQISSRLKSMPSHVFVFPLEFKANQVKTILIKSQTTAILSAPISILNNLDLFDSDTSLYLFYGLYFGFILSILIFCLVIYFYTKSNSILYYALYGISNFIMVFAAYGLGFRYFYPDSVFIQNRIFIVAVGINGIFLILFSRTFLKTKLHYPKLDQILQIWIVLLLIWVSRFSITASQDNYYYIPFIATIPIVIITLTGISESRRNVYAVYFVIAWVLFLIFYVLSALRLLGYIPLNFFTYYSYQIGSMLQMVFITLSIGHKTYDIRKQRDRFNNENIRLKENANKELIKLVEERTFELNKKNKLIEKEIEMAWNIQLNTLPNALKWKDDRVSISSIYLPKDRVSGDIYDFFKIDDDRYRFFIADATGHGVQAAFLTMSIQTEYQRVKSQFSDPAQVLRLLNNSRFKTFGKDIVLYSCCIIDIDIDQNFLVYASCGHPSQYLFQDNNIIELSPISPLIGFRDDILIRSKTLEIKDNFKLFLLSDGVLESRNSQNEYYGEENLKKIIFQSMDKNPTELNNEIFMSVNEFIKDFHFEDDYTSLVIAFQK